MSAEISSKLSLLFSSPCRRYATKGQLVAGLLEVQTAAIECVLEKAEGLVRKMTRQFGLPPVLAADVLHDGILILIEKTRDGSYDPERAAPTTYLVAVCRNLLANHARLKRPPRSETLENGLELQDNSLTDWLEFRERKTLLEKLLRQIGPPCSDIIALKYLEGYSDEEQISLKMTPYSSVESLRVMRSRCMKSLAELAAKWKSPNDAS